MPLNIPKMFSSKSSLGSGLSKSSMPKRFSSPGNIRHSASEFQKPLSSISQASTIARPVSSVHDLTSAAGGGPTSSISRINNPARYSVADDKSAAERQNQLRWEYAQRQRVKAQESSPASDDGHGLHLGGTGKAFKDKGVTGFQKHLQKMVRTHKTTFGNMSQEDTDRLHGIIQKRVSHKTTGSDISNYDKKIMKREAGAAYSRGEISKEDLKDFKNIINTLKK